VLDSFGTHAEFNHPNYFSKNRASLGGKANAWGGNALNLKQFQTMYPHTDDNTFLGFVVETFEGSQERQNITLVYGKEAYMWKGVEKVVKLAAKYGEVHATIADINDEIRSLNVINHNLLSGRDFHALLQRSRVFLGIGFPIEGPAPLEAIANGAVFINPIFQPPKSRRTYKFFQEKPTLRELRSQNPYMERFVGEPRVLTIDIHDETALNAALSRIFNSEQPSPYLPSEFSFFGMLERVDVLITYQDFCSAALAHWPPFEAARNVVATAGRSCQDECDERNLICEPAFFPAINNNATLHKYGSVCAKTESIAEPYAPAGCFIQEVQLLFSCAAIPPPAIQRLCPCRTFKKEQSVLY
jgi:alpha-1,3(6)-mannosylglycoprotein beta-1,6-N-acetyl-glucosaminyltransferase